MEFERKKIIFIIALVVLIIIGTTFYIKRQVKNMSQVAQETCPTVDLETECFSEKCFAEIRCFDEPPIDEKEQGITTFENTIPEGFPEDMPIDPNPVEIIRSYTLTSYNPPPEDVETKKIIYVYLTNKTMAETFNELRDYVLNKGLTIEIEERGEKLYALYTAQGLNNDYVLNITIAPEGEEVFVVTISILTK